ncbi:MAG: diacylglycerol kinase [Bacilli bacterium]|jgi:undecaprenol kinase
MDMESRNNSKKKSIRRLINAFKYSIDGLKYAYKYEQSMTIHITVTTIVVIGGLYFEVSVIEWLFLFLLIGLIVGVELINTSIEATIDLMSPQTHPLAKIAKDTASAAVFILSTVAFVGGCIVFIPKIIERFF